MHGKKFVVQLLVIVWLAFQPAYGQQLVWSSPSNGTIWRANLDGSNAAVFVDINTATGTSGHMPTDLIYSSVNERIYWTENAEGQEGIFSINSDGGDVQMVVDPDVVFGEDDYENFGITTFENRIYWTAGNRIFSAELDGSDAVILIDGSDDTIDTAGGISTDGTFLFWVDVGTNFIFRANLDGSDVTELINVRVEVPDPFFVGPFDIIAAQEKIYWSDRSAKCIHRANVDGSEVEALVANVGGLIFENRPFGITEFNNSIFYGDGSLSSGTAIYQIDIDNPVVEAIVGPTDDDSYPLVIPGTAPVPPIPPSITDFQYDSMTGSGTITFTASPDRNYVLVESESLTFSPGQEVAITEVTVGTQVGDGVTTTGEGVASFSFDLDSSKGVNFLRVRDNTP